MKHDSLKVPSLESGLFPSDKTLQIFMNSLPFSKWNTQIWKHLAPPPKWYPAPSPLLVGGWPTPLKNMTSSIGMIIWLSPSIYIYMYIYIYSYIYIYMEKWKSCSNHQPALQDGHSVFFSSVKPFMISGLGHWPRGLGCSGLFRAAARRPPMVVPVVNRGLWKSRRQS